MVHITSSEIMTLSEQLATELARTSGSQQQSQEEDDDVIYNL